MPVTAGGNGVAGVESRTLDELRHGAGVDGAVVVLTMRGWRFHAVRIRPEAQDAAGGFAGQ